MAPISGAGLWSVCQEPKEAEVHLVPFQLLDDVEKVLTVPCNLLLLYITQTDIALLLLSQSAKLQKALHSIDRALYANPRRFSVLNERVTF